MTRTYVDIEGLVMNIGPKALWFRETGAAHDMCIPLSQIEDADAVSIGQEHLRVTRWILNKLEAEGER